MNSKNIAKAVFLSGIILVILSCAGGAAAKNADIADIMEKDWFLEEVKTGQSVIRIDRTGGANAVYTLKFDAERIGGAGAPNRYFAPYTAGEKNSLAFGMIGSTMMASLFERADLKEHEYFAYLGKVCRWDLKNGKLELYSLDGNAETVLIYGE